MTIKQTSGFKAKKDGHLNETRMVSWLSDNYGGEYIVDGGNRTKVDIRRTDKKISYSLKSVSGKNTQCHLTSVNKWCEYFKIGGNLRSWFDLFFGIPGEDVSNGKSSQHRLGFSDIDNNLNELALEWFNANKKYVFNVIVRSGMGGDCVDYLIWYNKIKGTTSVHNVNDLAELVTDGEWRFTKKGTVLEFISGGVKLFHLQMKGSGKKYTSGYHGLMFHIHL